MKRNNTAEEAAMTELLYPLDFLLRLSARAYEKYLRNKIYLHALNIRKANEMICKLVLDKIVYIPGALQQDCIELLNHYDCWLLQFIDEEQKRKPALNDEFVFARIDDQVAFPRLSEERIFEAVRKFNKQKKQRS